MNNENNIDVLNDLIEASRDDVESFRKFAEDAHDPKLKEYFQNRAKSCNETVRNLNEKIRKLSAEPETSATVKHELHRIWIDIKTAFTKNDNLVVLEERERADDVVHASYQNALEEVDLSDNLPVLITQQLYGVRKNHDGL